MRQWLLTPALLLLLSAPAGAASWGPWHVPPPAPTKARAPFGAGPLKQAVHFFQRYISPVDGPRCPMYPTCSAYAVQALDRHGPVLGVMMTVDRLLHETDAAEHHHPVQVGGRVRFYDPVSNNDFWFVRHRPAAGGLR